MPDQPPASDLKHSVPFQPNPWLAKVFLIAGLAIILATGLWWFWKRTSPGFTGGGVAATAGILFVLALIFYAPTLIMDDSPENGGEPSTMRIISLVIVLTFCALMLRTGWNAGTLPTLAGESNWVWLVTAALGGKVLQRYAEVKENTTDKKQ